MELQVRARGVARHARELGEVLLLRDVLVLGGGVWSVHTALSRVIGTLIQEAQSRLPSGAGRSFAVVAAMTMCPRCGSSFLQPLRCEAKGSDVVLVELRCSDCMTWLKAPHTRADMRELDRQQAEFRAVILEQYERSVAESMEALAACLGPALELDLVSADDFAPPRR
jgi:hypothetical protein